MCSYANVPRLAAMGPFGEKESSHYGSNGWGAPMSSGYGQPPKIRFEVIGEAWQLFTQQMSTWVIAVLIMFVAMMVPGIVMVIGIVGSGMLGGLAGNRAGGAVFGLGMMLMMFVGILLIAVITAVMMGGMYRMAIKQIRGEPIQISDLWSVTDVLMNLIGAGLLIGIAMGVAAMACVLPMYIVGGLLMLTIPLIVDKKLGIMEAATLSWNTLKGEWLMAAVLFFVLNFIAGIGAIAIYIGMLFTYPIMFLGTALVYRDFILGSSPSTGGGYPVGVTPGGYPPDLYAAQQPPPPADEQR